MQETKIQSPNGEIEELRLITTAEAQTILSLCDAKVKNLIASGELTSIKIGRSRRIRVSDIRRFIEERYDQKTC